MPERKLSAEAAARIEALCRRVAVGGGLDDEVRRELCAHMEDKAVAYLEGREALSEADALLLVERHFGHPEAVADGMRRVHVRAAADTVGRRLAAVLTLSCLAELARRLAFYVLVNEVDWLASQHHLPPMKLPAGEWVPLVGLGALPMTTLGATWGVLAWWRRRVRRGARVWYADWPWWAVMAVAGLALVEAAWVPPAGLGLSAAWLPSESWLRYYSRHFAAYAVADQVAAASTVFVWIWWCSPRGTRWSWSAVAGAVGGLGWLGWLGWRAIAESGWWWRPGWWERYVEWVLVVSGPWWAIRYAWEVAAKIAMVAVALLVWGLVLVVRRGRGATAA